VKEIEIGDAPPTLSVVPISLKHLSLSGRANAAVTESRTSKSFPKES